MDSPPNVSPTYGVYDRKSSQEAINERREARRLANADPAVRLQVQIDDLRKERDVLKKEIDDLKAFRAGMAGDENIKVDDNKITWVGKVPGNNLPATLFDVCVNGVPMVTNIPNDGFRALP